MGALDGMTMDLKCAGCGHQFQKRVGSMKRNFNCPACGLTFRAAELAAEIDALNRKTDSLAKGLKRFGGKG